MAEKPQGSLPLSKELDGANCVRSLQPGEEQAVVDLLNEVFAPWPAFDLPGSKLDYWQWKYVREISQTGATSVAVRDGRIIGCDHSIIQSVKVGELEQTACVGADHAILREFQDQRLSRPIYELAQEMRSELGVRFVYFETLHPRLIKAFSKSCMLLPLHMRHLVRLRDPGRHLRQRGHRFALLKSLLYRGASMLQTLVNRPPRPGGPGLSLETITRFGSEFDKLWEDLSPAYRFIARRDANFLNWRFQDLRGGQYRIRAARRQGRIEAFLVTRVDQSDPEYPIGYFVDWLSRPESPDALQTLFGEAVDRFDGEGINVIHALVPGHHASRRLLPRFGFLDTRERNAVFARQNEKNEELDALEAMSPGEGWYSYGDIDSI